MSNNENTNAITPVTAEEARTELNRRRLPKGSAERKVFPRQQVLAMGGVELKAIAGNWTPAPTAPKPAAVKPAKPAKPERTEIQKLHTRLRAEAYAWKVAQYHAGNKVTLKAAYEKFATAPAGITNAAGFTGV